MTKRIRVHEGDLFTVKIYRKVAVGIVLHVSRIFRGGMLVGFYRQLYTPRAIIEESSLGGPFIDMPNYAPTKTITMLGRWPVIGHSDALLSKADIPTLLVGGSLYYKDEYLRTLEVSEYAQFQPLRGRGYVVVEDDIRAGLRRLGLLTK